MGVSTDALDASAPAWTAESEGIAVPCMSSDHFGQKNDFAKRRFSVFF